MSMKQPDVNKLLDIGIALSKEKDYDKLLEIILREAMDITSCDAGTIYTLSGEALHFKIMITKSMDLYKGGKDTEALPPVPLSRKNVCACCAMDKALVNIADVYDSDKFDFSGPRNYDALTGYKTTSMLVIPMEDDYGDVIGVLQLINALNGDGRTIPFARDYEQVILSLASQAAICLTNVNYAREIITLLNSFVGVMSTAIDARTPYNANHTRNMARYGEAFIDWLNESGNAWQFSDAEKRQILMSVWLHDVGKLVIPLEVMDKDSRLGARLENVMHRLEVMELLAKLDRLGGSAGQAEAEGRLAEVAAARELIEKANKAGFLPEETLEQIKALGAKTYTDAEGRQQPWLTEDELTALSVQKGTLTAAERETMESHVVMTEKMLGEMQFSRDYKKAPEWAAAHHEFLNGRGYPRHIQGEEISREVRLITILDVFDALTARDRPYKPPMSTEKAFGILDAMVGDGQIDGEILALFKESGAWQA